jgi:hypothetical protein
VAGQCEGGGGVRCNQFIREFSINL